MQLLVMVFSAALSSISNGRRQFRFLFWWLSYAAHALVASACNLSQEMPSVNAWAAWVSLERSRKSVISLANSWANVSSLQETNQLVMSMIEYSAIMLTVLRVSGAPPVRGFHQGSYRSFGLDKLYQLQRPRAQRHASRLPA